MRKKKGGDKMKIDRQEIKYEEIVMYSTSDKEYR